MTELRVETRCVLAREDPPSVNRPLVAPIYQSAVWAFDGPEELEAVYAGEPGFIYSRDANPNQRGLESAVAALEGACDAVVFGTGMGAVAGAITSLTRHGGRIVAARQLYGVSARLLAEEMSRFGVTPEWVDVTDLAAVEKALSTRTDVLLVETLANPLLQVADIPALAELCRDSGCALAVDSTFAPPLVCRPLDLGADFVIQSLTKVLGGHSDLTLGVVSTRRPELSDGLRRYASLWGAAANPFASWLALRGLTTYPLRIERACDNALELARRLQRHPAVARVYYPWLASHPQYPLARRLLTRGGYMLAFDTGNAPEILRRLQLVRLAPSLGDVATTISYPIATSHRGLEPPALTQQGIGPQTLRLSVGIDHVEDVWADLVAALGTAG